MSAAEVDDEWIDLDLFLPRERVFFETLVCMACGGRGVVPSPYHVVTILPDGTRRDGWPCWACGARGFDGRVIREKIRPLSPEQEQEALKAIFDLVKDEKNTVRKLGGVGK